MAHPLLSFPVKGVFRISLLICLLHHTMFALAAATIPYDLQSNGVICSPYFGAPLLEDCQNAILEYETDRESDRDGLYASVIVDDDPKASLPLPLPWVFTNGMALVSPLHLRNRHTCRRGSHVPFCRGATDPSYTTHLKRKALLNYMHPQDDAGQADPLNPGTCVFAISIVRGGRNNVTGSLLSDIAQTVAPTCASLPASQGGWGAYGTSHFTPFFPHCSLPYPPHCMRCNQTIRPSRQRLDWTDIPQPIPPSSSPLRIAISHMKPRAMPPHPHHPRARRAHRRLRAPESGWQRRKLTIGAPFGPTTRKRSVQR